LFILGISFVLGFYCKIDFFQYDVLRLTLISSTILYYFLAVIITFLICLVIEIITNNLLVSFIIPMFHFYFIQKYLGLKYKYLESNMSEIERIALLFFSQPSNELYDKFISMFSGNSLVAADIYPFISYLGFVSFFLFLAFSIIRIKDY
jgi:hypothetical protein